MHDDDKRLFRLNDKIYFVDDLLLRGACAMKPDDVYALQKYTAHIKTELAAATERIKLLQSLLPKPLPENCAIKFKLEP